MASKSLEQLFEEFDGCSVPSPEVLAALEKVVAKPKHELASFKPSGLAGTALAAGCAEVSNHQLFEVLCDRARLCIAAFEPSDLTAFIWALCVQDYVDEATLTAIAVEVEKRAWEFDAESLAKVIVAFAELRVRHDAMLETVSMEIMWKIDQFSARSLGRLCSAFASLGFCKEPMLDWIALRVIGRIGDFGTEDLAAVAEAYAELQVRNDPLMESIAAEAAKKCGSLDDDDLSRLAAAFSLMYHADARPAPDFEPRGLQELLYQEGAKRKLAK
eukprot:gnl/MRDRNA2_/MRDRNA2_69530_c0_seq1.p1 gnl/MRDRNA2_/MRDRNA2_69530_c0~~gnl/MRDRNA2_/MRDRNA2_69530_c0_seq1.p1  ORF type:complete len:273 (+),score=75.80 gnl/MRDRNA2_/MRDRNA2_69530_c0_seq1:70-888(+)